jgi:hypothetical protein
MQLRNHYLLPYYSGLRTQINLERRIRIRIRVKSWIRIRIQVKNLKHYKAQSGAVEGRGRSQWRNGGS